MLQEFHVSSQNVVLYLRMQLMKEYNIKVILKQLWLLQRGTLETLSRLFRSKNYSMELVFSRLSQQIVISSPFWDSAGECCQTSKCTTYWLTPMTLKASLQQKVCKFCKCWLTDSSIFPTPCMGKYSDDIKTPVSTALSTARPASAVYVLNLIKMIF